MDIQQIDGTLVYRLDGTFDSEAVALARTKIDSYLANEVSVHAFDLSNTVFMDSSAIGLLVYMHKRLAAQEKKFYLVGPVGQPDELLRMLRINKVIEIRDNMGLVG